jgi:hypothetical protein
MTMYAEYDFFTPPVFESFDGISEDYEEHFEELMAESRLSVSDGAAADPDGAYSVFMSELNQ